MALQPSDTAGYWADSDWDGTSPATFAVLIGVSAYRHLKDGAAPVAGTDPWMREAISLGQLYVSALTARRMLHWLEKEYRMSSAPLARAWLLAAPTADERSFAPEVGDNILEPTLDNCRKAIRAWASAPDALPPAAQSRSRAIFFFSGHGIQSTVQNQMLLPSDYLGNDQYADINDAISSLNIRMGMKSVKVGVRYYFLDACRNDAQALREQKFDGTNILNVEPSRKTYQEIAFDAVLNATTASKQAWQPKRAQDGETIFGQALLEGLRAANIAVPGDQGRGSIRFLNLFPFVRFRVPALIRKSGSNAVQDVTPLMEHDVDGVVTELDLAEEEAFEVAPAGDGGGFEAYRSSNATDALAHYLKAALGGQDDGTPDIRERQELDDPALQAAGWAQDFGVGHRLFGHESVTALFSGSLRVAALEGGTWVDPARIRVLRVDRSETFAPDSQSHATYRIRLIIDEYDLRGHWLQLSDFGRGGVGVVLPRDGSGKTGFDLDVTMSLGSEPRILSLDAVPWDGDRMSPLARAAGIWRKYQTADWRGALDRLEDAAELRDLVAGKRASPLAATIAATVLLRANRLDLIGEWLHNLADWFPHLPDGPVLWAEQLWRQGSGDDGTVVAVAEYLVEAAARGVPMTSDAMSYADALLGRLAQETDSLPDGLRARLDRESGALRRALRVFRPGGLFCSYFHFAENSQPMGQLAGQMEMAPANAPEVDVDFAEDGVMINGIFLPRAD